MVASNALPPDLVAYHLHMIQRAMLALEAAKAGAKLDGIAPALLKRGIRMAGRDPEKLFREQADLAAILAAIGSPLVEPVAPDLFERVIDETDAARTERFRRAGRMAAIMCEPATPPGLDGQDAQDWLAGFNDTTAAIAAIEKQRGL